MPFAFEDRAPDDALPLACDLMSVALTTQFGSMVRSTQAFATCA